MGPLLHFHNRPFLFLAEGVFMYLHQEDVKSLILKLQASFPNSELVAEVVNSFWLRKSLKWMINVKLQREFHLGKEATYNFGIKDSRDLESWHPGLKFLDEWSYVDEPEPKLGALRYFRHINLFRKTQWTIHYKLGGS
jgi:O-methyltransferase involved in polyketide biosynthesis